MTFGRVVDGSWMFEGVCVCGGVGAVRLEGQGGIGWIMVALRGRYRVSPIAP